MNRLSSTYSSLFAINARSYIASFYFFLTLLLWSSLAMAQSGGINISGKITSQGDGEPVGQASISIARKGVGTSANKAGMYLLIIPATNIGDTLRVSCIGYQSKQFPVTSLKNGQVLNVSLEKNTTELKEVTVHYYDPIKIINKAINRIGDNYIDHPHILRGFYRMYTYSDANPLQLSEAVFDVYNFGYADKRADQFRLIKARNDKNERDFAALEFGQKPNTVFESDVINHLYVCGFLNDEGLEKHQFEVRGIVDFQGNEAYQINFKEKVGSKGATYRGRMYVDTKTYAFIHFDYGLSPSGLTNLGYEHFATRSLMRMGNVQIDLKQDHSTVNYQEVGHQWVLANVSGENLLSIKDSTTKTNLIAHVKFNYQVTAVDTVAKSSFSSKIGGNENINDHGHTGDPEFWKDYNILLSDYDTEDIFKQIQTINQLIKLKK